MSASYRKSAAHLTKSRRCRLPILLIEKEVASRCSSGGLERQTHNLEGESSNDSTATKFARVKRGSQK